MHRFLASAACLLLLLTACARLGAGGSSGATPSGSSPGAPNISGAWQLQRGSGASGRLDVPAGSRVTIAFDGKRVSGQACNIYGGDYRLESDGTIRLSAMSMTEMACQEPMMSLEAAYHAALLLVHHVAVSGEQLTLSGDGVELVFTRLAPVADADLVGTHWTLTTLFQGDVASSVIGKGWLQLDAHGTLSGSTGCRGFDAAYEVSGDRLRITHLVTEDNACEPSAKDQDQLVLDLLGGGLAYAIDGQQLTLTDAGVVGGKGLGYSAAQE